VLAKLPPEAREQFLKTIASQASNKILDVYYNPSFKPINLNYLMVHYRRFKEGNFNPDWECNKLVESLLVIESVVNEVQNERNQINKNKA
jgi:hypothetical protein